MFDIKTCEPSKGEGYTEFERRMNRQGFAAFNHFPHAMIKSDEDQFTISVCLKDGRQVTFSFVDTGKGPSGCVDIEVHNPQHEVYRTNTNGKRRPVLEFIAFGNGGRHVQAYRVDEQSKNDPDSPFFMTILLDTPPIK